MDKQHSHCRSSLRHGIETTFYALKLVLDGNWTTKFHSQWTSHMDPSVTSIAVTGSVGECLQAGAEDAPILDCSAPLRRFHDSGAGYNIQTYLLTYIVTWHTYICHVTIQEDQCKGSMGLGTIVHI